MTKSADVPVHLTPRQRDVLTLLSRGLTRQKIAAALGLKPSTVSSLTSVIFQALHVHSAAQAVRAAHLRGLIGEPDGCDSTSADGRRTAPDEAAAIPAQRSGSGSPSAA